MGEKLKICVFCNKDVEMRKITTHGNYEEQIQESHFLVWLPIGKANQVSLG